MTDLEKKIDLCKYKLAKGQEDYKMLAHRYQPDCRHYFGVARGFELAEEIFLRFFGPESLKGGKDGSEEQT